MSTVEIPPENWQLFCTRLTEACRGSTVSLEEVARTDRGPFERVENAPLVSLSMDPAKGQCSDLILLEVETPAGTRPTRHTVTQPIHIRLRNGANDRYNLIQVDAEKGAMVLKLNPGLTPAQIESWGVL